MLLCCNFDVKIFTGSSAPASFQCFKGTACIHLYKIATTTTTQTDTVYVQIVNVQLSVFYLTRGDLMRFILALVEHTTEPSGVAGCCHPDLLLPVCGLWRSHIIRKLQ